METQEPTNNSGSLATPEDKARIDETVLNSVIKEVQELKQKLHAIENKTILEELKLPEEDLKALGILKDEPTRIKSGKGRRPILESEIKEAQSKCNNASDCARYLKISYSCYKKWAKFYGIFKINPWGKGDKKRYWAPDKGKYPLNQLLEGKFPDYPVHRLKDVIIRSGTKKAECENCGFDERRITDHKMPLLISFKDGDHRNHKLENIQILCYNCMFLIGRGYIHRGRVKYYFYDCDLIQGAGKKIPARF